MSDTHAASDLLIRREGTLDELRAEAEAGRLYAILDACDEPRVPEMCEELGPERAVSLYRGMPEETYWAIAPYLAVADPPMLDWIVSELSNEPWGIFAVTNDDLDTIRRHFRRFLIVSAPDGEQWYFRLYDPRVLSRFLPTCSADQLQEILSPISSLATLDKERKVVWFAVGLERTRLRRGIAGSP